MLTLAKSKYVAGTQHSTRTVIIPTDLGRHKLSECEDASRAELSVHQISIAFGAVDLDRDGLVDVREFIRAVQSLNPDITEEVTPLEHGRLHWAGSRASLCSLRH